MGSGYSVIAGWAHRDDDRQRRNEVLALLPIHHRIERPQCLENPRPKGGLLNYSLTESASSPVQAEPSHNVIVMESESEPRVIWVKRTII
jgi:hypothetical protein